MMKKLLTAVMAVGLIVSGVAGANAQDTPTASATGLNSPATYFDTRGNEVATVEVTGVQEDWAEYDEYSAPDRGYAYRAVEFTVTNVSDTSMIVENYDFSLLDATGRNSSSAWVSPADDSTTALFEDDVPLGGGESADLVLVFETPSDIPAQALLWQPDYGTLVSVNFGEAGFPDAAMASGFDTPSTWTDDRGNPVATLEVTGVTADWDGYSEYSEPERGMMYYAVDITVTNVSDRSMILSQYNFTMVDSSGLNNSAAWVSVADGSDEVLFTEDVPLAAGESYDGTIVFSVYTDLEPAAVVWQPDSGILNIVQLGTGAAPADATPEVDATPAA